MDTSDIIIFFGRRYHNTSCHSPQGKGYVGTICFSFLVGCINTEVV